MIGIFGRDFDGQTANISKEISQVNRLCHLQLLQRIPELVFVTSYDRHVCPLFRQQNRKGQAGTRTASCNITMLRYGSWFTSRLLITTHEPYAWDPISSCFRT